MTQHLSTSPADIAVAASLLRTGELVAFPTETVYGLGASALDHQAVAKIFVAKGRPSDNPLIVHIYDVSQLQELVIAIPPAAQSLMKHFWPGPLTLVFAKQSGVSELITAGLNTVAVRLPSHPIARELIRAANLPIAAPSANRSGRPSATTWQAVSQDLDGRIAAILCGEPTHMGLESTVVDVVSETPRILRPGGIGFEQLQSVLPHIQPYAPKAQPQQPVNSPGLRHKHYQPRAQVRIVDRDALQCQLDCDTDQACFIGLETPPSGDWLQVRLCGSVEEYAHDLFDFFRQCDAVGARFILCQSVPSQGVGTALMDRLCRASEQS